MKVLIFYSHTGGGHLRCAENIAQQLKKADPKLKVSMRDGLAKTDLLVEVDPKTSYHVLSTKFLWFYNLFYRLTDTPMGTKLFRIWIKNTWGRTISRIIEQEKPDLILSTHEFISPATITGWQGQLPFVTVVTDLGKPHRVWFDRRSLTILPTEEMRGYAKKMGLNMDFCEVLGYPLRGDMPKANKAAQFSDKLLFITSGLDLSTIKQYVDKVLDFRATTRILLAGGDAAKLEKFFQAYSKRRLQIMGFVANLPKLMSECDVIITKAGPATILEAAAMERPMILVKSVGLQEADNVRFITQRGLGVYCPKADSLLDYLETIYKSYPQFSKGTKIDTEGSDKIAKQVLRLLD